VMEEGQVIERGTQEELLALGGVYAEMWARQVDEDFASRLEDLPGGKGEPFSNERLQDRFRTIPVGG